MDKSWRYPILAALILFWLPGAGKAWSGEVEGSASLSDLTRKEARTRVLDQVKQKAVSNYISSRVPPRMMEEKAPEREKILSQVEQWVVSWEELEEREEEGRLVLKVRVELSEEKLDSALKAAGIFPSRPLPRVLVLVPGTMGGDKLMSAWDKAPGQRGTFNLCEAAGAREFRKYGFPVIEARAESPSLDTAKVTAPEGEEERQEVFRELAENFRAQALVVGRVTAQEVMEEGEAPAEAIEIVLRMAAADVAKGDLVWSDEIQRRVEGKGVIARDRALDQVCEEAGAGAMEALFRAWTPEYLAGEEHEILVAVQGVDSYSRMKELERRLREEGPGVKSAVISRMAPGELEFRVVTVSDAAVLGEWLSGNVFDGLRLEVEILEETVIKARARN